ncbi:MAG: hypothetical protein GEV28_34045 [Actinophytocola sp.]|uniref:hypothetical protein n=1 Tax=Actinophytocola sp. TaxID=1872138 RepID=UPI0013266ED8|nr:hypothetical protein [Actinophytocola sp.]MPZ85141.1 hypothetical protein [Actinophytocola sp.]
MRLLAMAAVAAVLLVGVSGTSASADEGPAGFDPEPWQPYEATDFVAPAGKYCAFDLAVAALEDEEEVRVDARYADGAVRLYEYRGKLVARFTNMATGESAVRDLSGRAWTDMYPDGVTMRSFTGLGPFSLGFRAEDGYPRGYYRLDGLHSISFSDTGIRDMTIDAGPAENMCATLS